MRAFALALLAIVTATQSAYADTPHLATASMERFSTDLLSESFSPRVEGEVPRGRVRIAVRLIRARTPLTNAELIKGPPKLELDARMRDLDGHLSRLRYRDFTLLAIQERVTELMKRESISLGDGYSLTMRPMYVERGRVGMWIRWQDPHGHPVLDTRLHFRCGQTVVAGMDGEGEAQAAVGESSQEEALILAIDAHPADPVGADDHLR